MFYIIIVLFIMILLVAGSKDDFKARFMRYIRILLVDDFLAANDVDALVKS